MDKFKQMDQNIPSHSLDHQLILSSFADFTVCYNR